MTEERSPEERLRRVLRDLPEAQVPERVYRALRSPAAPRRRLQLGLATGLLITVAAGFFAILFAILLSGRPTTPGRTPLALPSQGGKSLASLPGSTPAASAGVAALGAGQSTPLACDAEIPPVFSPSGTRTTCGTSLVSWPELQQIVQFSGAPVAWGGPGGRYLLVAAGGSRYEVLDEAGRATAVPVPGDAQLLVSWLADTDLLVVGVRRSAMLELATWRPGTAALMHLVNIPGVWDRATLSADRASVLVSNSSCASSPGACLFSAELFDIRHNVVASFISSRSPGIVTGDGFLPDGRYWLELSAGGELEIWQGGPSGQPHQLVSGANSVWLIDGYQAVVTRPAASPTAIVRLSLNDGSLVPFDAAGTWAADLRGVSPDGQWIVSSAGSRRMAVRQVGGSAGWEMAVPTDTFGASVTWVPGGRWVILFTGPPPALSVARIRP